MRPYLGILADVIVSTPAEEEFRGFGLEKTSDNEGLLRVRATGSAKEIIPAALDLKPAEGGG